MSQSVGLLSLLFLAGHLTACLGAATVVPGQLTIPPPTSPGDGCILMTPDILRYCSFNSSRNCTALPNAKGHTTLIEAKTEFYTFLPLINRAKCSPLLPVFLCFYYFPIVPPQNLPASRSATIGRQFLPCRSVCESVRDSCEPTIIRHEPQIGGWPDHLNCSLFPEDSTTRACIKPAVFPPTSTTAPPTRSPTTSATTPSSPTDSGEPSGSGEEPSTETTTSPPRPGVCIQPNTNQSRSCSCAKLRASASGKALEKGKYSFMAKVKILSTITPTQRGQNIGYRARIEENFPISCSGTSRLQTGTEITLQTDMSPDCLCATVEINQEYVVAGYATSKVKLVHLPTDKDIKYGNNGGCVFGCWNSKYSRKLSAYARRERPVNCSA